MSKLNDYIKDRIFPIVRTGISNNDWVIQTWKRKAENITYTCSLCDCEIGPNEILHTEIKRGYTVPRDGFIGVRNESEVLGFICNTCYEEISEYDNLYYG